MTELEKFFREKMHEEYQLPRDFMLRRMDFLNAEKAVKWALDFGSQSKPQEIEWIDKKEISKQAFHYQENISKNSFADANTFIDACEWLQSELQTRIKPVDTKTVDAVEWIRLMGFEPFGKLWKRRSNGIEIFSSQELLNLYKQDIESKK